MIAVVPPVRRMYNIVLVGMHMPRQKKVGSKAFSLTSVGEHTQDVVMADATKRPGHDSREDT